MTEDDDDPGVRADGATIQGNEPVISLDATLELLANQRRRFVVYALADAVNGVIGLEALSEEVATLEAALADEALTKDRYFEVVSDLYHWHLPVLADAGVVDCDDRSEDVRYYRSPMLERWAAQIRRDELGDGNAALP